MKTLILIAWSMVLVGTPIIDNNSAVGEQARTQEIALLQGTSTPSPATPSPTEVEWIDIGGGLDFYYYFAPNEYAMYVLGEVRNRNAEAVHSPVIYLTLLDGDGNIVGTQDLIDLYPIVEPGTTTPYQVVLDPSIAPESWESETVEAFIPQEYGPAACSTKMEFRDVVEQEKSPEQLRISGKIYNGGTLPLDGVLVWVAIYGTDGVYAGMTNESIGATIPPGKTAAFSVFGGRAPGLLLPDSSPDYTYRLFATNITGGSTYC